MSESKSYHIAESESLIKVWVTKIKENPHPNGSVEWIQEIQNAEQLLRAAQVHATLAVAMR